MEFVSFCFEPTEDAKTVVEEAAKKILSKEWYPEVL